ncbi:hypothetical protein BGX38DRAFT_1236920, partial [Terfezia claveryi]
MRAPLPYLLPTLACMNEYNMRARASLLYTHDSTSQQSAEGQAEVRTSPVHSRDIPQLY